jgi:hypothetical protein
MADLVLLPNPDNIPGAVSSGYQRQNTNFLALQTGLDTIQLYDSGTSVKIYAGGIIEINGSIFKITNDVTITYTPSGFFFFIAVKDNGNGTASFSFVNSPGIYYPDKKSYYQSDGRRTIKFAASSGLAAVGSSVEIIYETTKGLFTRYLEPGWYYLQMNSGSGNGNGADATAVNPGNGGTVKNSTSLLKMFYLEKGESVFFKCGGSGDSGGRGKGSGNNWGGGGGSGSGEESWIQGDTIFFATDYVKPGKGGLGYGSGGDGFGSGPNSYIPDFATSGFQGIDGKDRPDGVAGGYIRMWRF